MEKIIICRCEDVTYEQVKRAIKDGYTILEEIKRVLRCGMGPCQGRTCIRLIAQIIAKETETTLKRVQAPRTRPPVRPVPLGIFFAWKEEEDEK